MLTGYLICLLINLVCFFFLKKNSFKDDGKKLALTMLTFFPLFLFNMALFSYNFYMLFYFMFNSTKVDPFGVNLAVNIMAVLLSVATSFVTTVCAIILYSFKGKRNG